MKKIANTRYADNILLYAKSLSELEQMLALLIEELASVRLEIHDRKTKNSVTDLRMNCNIVYKLLGMYFTSIVVGY